MDRSEARILLESTGSVSAEIPAPTRANYTRWVWQKLKELGKIHSRFPTSSGNHGNAGKSLKTVPCMEKSWNLKKPE